MRKSTLKLTRALSLILTVFLLTISANDIYGQRVSREMATKNARKLRSEAGFQKINFPKSTLQTILLNAEAIKLYNGIQNGSRRTGVLMAIGLDADGKEIGDAYIQANEAGQVTKLSRALKDLQVKRAQESSRIVTFTSAFGKADLMALLNTVGVNGLDFLPSKTDGNSEQTVLTLTVSPSGSSMEVQQMQSMRSPCPPECFQ